MKQLTLNGMSLWMILLVVLIPLQSSLLIADESLYDVIDTSHVNLGTFGSVDVLSSFEIKQASSQLSLLSISEVRTSGSDGQLGVRKDDDVTMLHAVIASSDPVDPTQVWLGATSAFTSCDQPQGAEYVCSLQIPGNGTAELDARRYTYNVYYFNEPQNETPNTALADSVKQADIYVDMLPPQLASLNAVPNRIGAGNFTLTYNINDRTCSNCDVCAGVSEIVVSKGNGTIFTESINGTRCNEVGSFRMPSSLLEQGENQIIATPIDNFGREGTPMSLGLYVDTATPNITGPVILDRTGREVEFVAEKPQRITILVDIIDDDLDASAITADFSPFKPGFQNVPGNCNFLADRTECRWTLTVDFGTLTTQAFTVTAQDNFGNVLVEQLDMGVTIDGDRPQAVSLVTDKIDTDGTIVIGDNTTITATFNETGSGFHNREVYLDLSSVGVGKKQADSCDEGWTCVWNEITVQGFDGTQAIFLTADSTDDVGNRIDGESVIQVRADSSAPLIQEVIIKKFRDGEEVATAATGDTLEIVATIREDSSISATANLSGLIEGVDALQGSCTQLSNESDIWGCTFTTSAIDRSGPMDTTLTVSVTDFAGNTANAVEEIEVLGVSNATANFWDSSVICTPGVVDREVTPFVNYRVYCEVSLQSPNAIPLQVEKGSCSDEGGYLQSDQLIIGEDSTKPVLELVLETGEYRVDSADFSCGFFITSQVGDTLYTTAEEEEVNISIQFYTLPLGEFSEEVDDKIDTALEKTEGLWYIVGLLKDLFYYAEKICGIIGTINKIVTVFDGIAKVVNVAAVATEPIPGVNVKMEVVNAKMCTSSTGAEDGAKGFLQGGGPLCEFVTCSGSKKENQKTENSGLFGNLLGGIDNWNNWGNGVADGVVSGFGGAQDIPVIDYFASTGGLDFKEYANPRENLLVALLTGCIPGIIYGIEKYRQIECGYGVCLQEAVKGGVPISACDEQKEYQTCKYIWGEIFAVLPWTAFFDYLTNQVKAMLSDPLTIIGGIASLLGVCQAKCVATAPGTFAWRFASNLGVEGLCSFVQWLSIVGEVLSEIQAIFTADFWDTTDDLCWILNDNAESEGGEEGEENEEDDGGLFGGIL